MSRSPHASTHPALEVTPERVHAMREQGESFLLLDCRTRAEYGIARLSNATLLPVQELFERVGELEPYRDSRMVIYCHHGVRSLQMAAWMRARGFAHACSMAGGIDAWSLRIDPAVPRY